jgi:hypothetical protein
MKAQKLSESLKALKIYEGAERLSLNTLKDYR